MSIIEILIADGLETRGKRVAGALEATGHPCEVVTQGAAALEVALVEHPRVIVADADLPLVDAPKLAEILRANPRTRGVRFLFLSATEMPRASGSIGDATLVGDVETDEVLDAITVLLQRQERVDRLESRATSELDVSGDLRELSPAELLQMLHLRRSTGRLNFECKAQDTQSANGSIVMADGEILAAELGRLSGEKALFRMLGWRSGGFDFVPGQVAGPTEIVAPTRSLLAEGLRQLDEWNRLAPRLPSAESPVRLCVDPGDLPQLVHPLTEEVLGLLGEFDRVGDIVDHCSRSDYQVLRTLHTLSERGIAEFGCARAAVPEPPDQGAFFSEDQIRRLRAHAHVNLGRDEATPDAKLIVVPASPKSLERFVSALTKIPQLEVAPRDDSRSDGNGWKTLETVARVDVDGSFAIDLVHLPAEAPYEALAALATHRALGTLLLLDAGIGESTAKVAAIARELAEDPAARCFNVVLLGAGEQLSPTELSENISLIDRASLFLLPAESEKDSGSLVRRLFARIVP